MIFRRLSLVVSRLNKSVAEQRLPKPFTIYHSPYILSWDSNLTLQLSILDPLQNFRERFHTMATKERSTRETGACVRDCQSYRVKPVVFQKTQLKAIDSESSPE